MQINKASAVEEWNQVTVYIRNIIRAPFALFLQSKDRIY